jgi:hypothetical protein
VGKTALVQPPPPPPFLKKASAGHIFKDDVNGFSFFSDVCFMGCEWYTDLDSLSHFYRAGWVDLRNRTVERLLLKEANPMSCVFKILTPHPPLRPASVYPPPLLRREDTLARGRGGGGVNILEDARHSSVLYLYRILFE